MDKPTTTAVVVTYQSRNTIDAALSRARECHEAGMLNCVVVDNRSDDGTLEYVKSAYPFAKAIDGGANLGFGRGCNLGAKEVSTPYTLFLNPDATLTVEDLGRLIAFMDERPDVGICAPAIAGQEAGLMARPQDILLESAGLRGFPLRRPSAQSNESFQTNWVCGAALLIRTQLFRDLSGFDPRFFLYFEETDLCRRAVEAGAEIWVVSSAVATHLDGASARQSGQGMFAGCIAEHYFRSRNYYFRKHYGPVVAGATELAEVGVMATRAVAARVLGRTAPLGLFKQRLSGGLFRLPKRSSTTPGG